MTGRARGAVLAAASVLALSACSGSSQSKPAPSSKSTDSTSSSVVFDSYVALGDSFVSGPAIDPIDRESPGCLRSTRNWPRLLAKGLQVRDFADASCAGATTQHLTGSTRFASGSTSPAQLDSVSKKTDLVTVGIGGNDQAVFSALMSSCSAAFSANVRQCSTYLRDTLPKVLQTTSKSIAAVLSEVRRRAPDARVLLVGYLRILPDDGQCKAAGVSGAAGADLVEGEQRLDDALADGARLARVDFLSLRELSSGHDACAGAEAWVNGIRPKAGDGTVVHPNAAGMQAAATAVAEHLGA